MSSVFCSDAFRRLRNALPGFETNPRVTSVDRAADVCRIENVDLVVALGGGSTMDAAKAICAAAKFEGPAYTVMAPARHTVAGSCGIMSH